MSHTHSVESDLVAGVPIQRPCPAGCPMIPADPASLHRKARLLEYFTCVWHVAEAAIGVAAGLAAGSVAVLGFGLSAVVELSAAVVVLWQMSSPERERRAQQLLALAFGGVAVVVVLDAIRSVVLGERSAPGALSLIAIGASVLMMLLLAYAKIHVGRRLGSRALQTDGVVSLVDGLLGVGVFLSLVLTIIFGWWWTDPLAAVVVAFFTAKAARDTWRSAA